MIIELSYWDMFWIGVTVGVIVSWVLCRYVSKLLNIQFRSHSNNQIKPNYLKPVKFKYQPTQYFKYVPVKEIRLHNQGRPPEGNKAPPKPKHNPHK